MTLQIALSFCPNDTYIFAPFAKGVLPFACELHLHDIDTLNHYAKEGRYDVTKMSAYCYAKVTKEYEILPCGITFTENAGPKFVTKSSKKIEEMSVAIPGEDTTAAALFFLLVDKPKKILFLPYHKIIGAIHEGVCDAGVLIHESGFVFEKHGLKLVCDLGKSYCERFRAPLPLGLFARKRTLPKHTAENLCLNMQSSLLLPKEQRRLCEDFIKDHAQEKDSETIRLHIEHYIHDETFMLSKKGKEALSTFFGVLSEKNLLKEVPVL
jgi:1,4-dihydroxy-6-naphthoate synthase